MIKKNDNASLHEKIRTHCLLHENKEAQTQYPFLVEKNYYYSTI